MDRAFIRNFIIFTVVSVTSFAFLLVALDQKSAKVTDMRESVTHTYGVLETATRIGTLSESMINAQRAYIISGKPGFMDEYNGYKNEMSATLSSFADLTSDNQSQQNRLSELRGFYSGLAFNLEERAQRFVKSDMRGFAEGAGTIDMLRKNILRVNGDMIGEEKQLLSERVAQVDKLRDQYTATLYIGSAACMVLMLTLNLFLLTSQKRKIHVENSLRESEDRFEKAAEGANDGIFDWDLPNDRIYCARPFFAMMGLERPAENISVAEFMSFIHPDDAAEVETAIKRYLGGEKPSFVVEYRMRHASGRWIWILARAMAVYNTDAEPVRLIGANTDITSMKAIQERLETAKQEAEKASLSKSEFLAHMSHEIRTPLTAVCGVAEILEKQKNAFDEKQKKLIDALNSSSHALKHLVNDILDYSKIEQGQIELEIREFDAAVLLAQIKTILAESAAAKKLDLIFDMTALEGVRAKGDTGRIRQILLNVIGNAIKFTKTGYVKVAARFTDDRTKGTRFLEIDVSDTGIGIDDTVLGSIFERFRQGDPSISRKFGGTGLGLPIARDLAKLMGGDVTVSSRKGVGSQFKIVIAVDDAAVDAVSGMQPDDELENAVTERVDAPTCVLVADDIEANLLVVGSLLEDIGVTYETVVNGKAALQATAAKKYGLVLMDVQMPELDGISATKRIREHEKKAGYPRVPIIGITAHAMSEDKNRCLEAGMDGYLTKPIETAEYIRIVTKYIDTKKAAAA